MKVIKNEVKPVLPEWPKEIRCRNCGSTLQIEREDVIRGTVVYSQREIDENVKGVNCPCCSQFTPTPEQ